MNSTAKRNAELDQAKERKAQAVERRKATAKRAYEAGEMTLAEIGALAKVDERTLKRWIADGGWEMKP